MSRIHHDTMLVLLMSVTITLVPITEGIMSLSIIVPLFLFSGPLFYLSCAGFVVFMGWLEQL